jgi:pSer/pThr/pTyr-binding forkhead associated (FHA) protein
MVTELNQSKFKAFATGEMKAVDARPKPQALTFQVQQATATIPITINLRPKQVLGRGDNQLPVDVDLTSLGAAENGMSRKHLMLMQHGIRILILDLGSTNGTRINNKVLRTGNVYELKDNDELQLGMLKLSVTFVYESITATALPTLLPEDSQAVTIPTVQSTS